ncbi:molybdenum cofactor guanylyltransferase [Qipengyuania sp.]|uniref:molybdenum cofactor guanylyltransferase n=1 Tax=Qipengyuania sp. TaxID=2004515 RepID=UPI003735D62C
MRVLGAVLMLGEGPAANDEGAAAARALRALKEQCAEVCTVGGSNAGDAMLAPWPRDNAGPLGLLAAALRHARERGLRHVLSWPADLAPPPAGLVRQLAPSPAHSIGNPMIGLWQVADLVHLDLLLASGRSHDVGMFAALSGARGVAVRGQS